MHDSKIILLEAFRSLFSLIMLLCKLVQDTRVFLGNTGKYSFCLPTAHHTVPTNPSIELSNDQSQPNNLCLIDLLMACRGCRAHCRDTKFVPVFHRPTLVSYVCVPSIIKRHKTSLQAPQSIISISCIFQTPCTFSTSKL